MNRKIIYVLFFVVTFSNSYSQKREKEAHYYYLSLGSCVYTHSPGTFNQKTFVTTEFRGSFGIFDIGIMVGRLSLMRSDTSWFTEVLPTINVFSKGRFSEALTLGAGYVFRCKTKSSN